MKLLEKLSVLTDAAKYDVACTSSGNARINKMGDTLGNAVKGGICHSFSADGRCISLLKILYSNVCSYDCAYCVNRKSNDVKRASFTPREVAYLTYEFYRRNYIEGLFLSSAVLGTPDTTMEQMIEAVRMLREDFKFNGYIHMKAIPGADSFLIEKAGRLVDRMSVNIELPSQKSLQLLAPEKSVHEVREPMSYITNRISETKNSYRNKFVPAGQSTQMIIGATSDSDYDILNLTENLYDKYRLKRVFYSAYIPTTTSSVLPAIKHPPLIREHRLYQADWLLRFYGFKTNELLDEAHRDLSLDIDPKCDFAIRNLDMFPVEINKADYFVLLRVPGIGVNGAKKIIQARRTHSLDFHHLKKMRIVLKRAKYFITCNGRMFMSIPYDDLFIRTNLLLEDKKNYIMTEKFEQLRLIDVE